jgi:hypothetical protein
MISSDQLLLLGIVSRNDYDGNVRGYGIKKNLAKVKLNDSIGKYCSSFSGNTVNASYFLNSVSIFQNLVEHPLEGQDLMELQNIQSANVIARQLVLNRINALRDENRISMQKTAPSSPEHLQTLPGIWKGRRVRRDKIRFVNYTNNIR